jgi:molybdenum cofactor cytidylyltransferase
MSPAVILAAGGGTRFEGPTHKLLAPLRGRPVYEWAIGAAVASGLTVIVVTGAASLDLPDGVIEVHNPDWHEGQATSLRAGLRAADELHPAVDAVVIGLGDQPFVDPSSWSRLAAAPSPIAIATYAGVRGNPVRLHRSIWDALPHQGDQGARSLIALRPELVGDVPCLGSAADIDTMEDLRTWNSSTNSP